MFGSQPNVFTVSPIAPRRNKYIEIAVHKQAKSHNLWLFDEVSVSFALFYIENMWIETKRRPC